MRGGVPVLRCPDCGRNNLSGRKVINFFYCRFTYHWYWGKSLRVEGPSLSPAAARVHNHENTGDTRRCPKCGSAQICPSRLRSLKDWLLFVLFLNPYRCAQCLRRFFRFRSRWARRAVTVTLCLIPVIILAAWFLELRSLQKVRALSAPDQTKSEPGQTKTIQQMLDKR